MNQRKRKLPSKKEGLWIQCCEENCKKWRFVKEYQDPLSVPEKWFCSQNLDKRFSSCDIPEEKLDNDLIESKYACGNIVWAKLKGYPWWPAIIDNSPETNTFYKLGTSNVPVSYHVTFLEEGKISCAWVKPAEVKPFKKDDGNQPKKARNLNTPSESLIKSLAIAKSALDLDIDNRLKEYSFLVQLEDSSRPKRRNRIVKYISPIVRNKKIIKEVNSPNHSRQDSSKNLKIDDSSSIFEMNQSVMSLINFPWNTCSIQ